MKCDCFGHKAEDMFTRC